LKNYDDFLLYLRFGRLYDLVKGSPHVRWMFANRNYLTLLGAAASGGLAIFLFACKRGIIRNNRYCRKAALEIAGGSVVGFFCGIADDLG
jgi:hypothetical protein